MAINIVSTSYNGEASANFYSAAIDQSGTIKGGHITILPNVKSKIALRKLDVGDILQADNCDFTPSGDIVLDERTLEVTPLKVNVTNCLDVLESDWISMQMASGSTAPMPADVTALLLDQMAQKLGNNIEKLIWAGDTAGAPAVSYMDGFLKIADNDLGTAKVPSPIVITSANVLAELSRGYNLIPDSILESANLRLYVSTYVFRAYTEAMNAIGGSNVYNIQNGFKQVFYKGIEVLSTQGMGTGVSRYMFAEKTNLTFGTDLATDIEDVRVINMLETTGEYKVRFIARMKAGVQYGVSSEIVIY